MLEGWPGGGSDEWERRYDGGGGRLLWFSRHLLGSKQTRAAMSLPLAAEGGH